MTTNDKPSVLDAPPAASAKPGSSAWLSDNTGSARKGDDPVAGNQFSCSANSDTNNIASQKLGTATPSDAKPITPLSIQLRGRLAASMPSGTPTRMASTKPATKLRPLKRALR